MRITSEDLTFKTSTMKYKVFIDDNFHYMDESHRYKLGEYNTLEKAIEACKKIVDEFLRENYKSGMTSDELSAQYGMFGEDPFKNFYYAKLEEYDAYRINVSQWERDRYITRL